MNANYFANTLELQYVVFRSDVIMLKQTNTYFSIFVYGFYSFEITLPSINDSSNANSTTSSSIEPNCYTHVFTEIYH